MRDCKVFWISLAVLLGVFLALSGIGLCGSRRTYGDISDVKYVRNYDGDTITFDIRGVHPLLGEKVSVRLRGVDTPEIRGRCQEERRAALMAKRFVANVLKKARRIDLKRVSRGKYFRIVADVEVDGRDLKALLLERGLAVPYYGGRKAICSNKGQKSF